ncbi:hypothetical protein [Chitinophaga sp. HK235]|uniref:hypothetical protein n=1 Tax=Chitinophaga sp. HK235 TaxID=2952571 RepID=UPI001BA7845E|nr:hypothetical protein [Chitinophaga sp. HK235]
MKTDNKQIEYIQQQLKQRKKLSKEEVNNLAKLINREAAGEYTNVRKENFANPEYTQEIIALANDHPEDVKVLRDIVSAIGFIAIKYQFYDQTGFDFLISHINNKNNIVKMAIAKNIFRYPQFLKRPDCWDYLLTIPSITPAKDSMDYFYAATQLYADDIPDKYLPKVLTALHNCIRKNNEQYEMPEYTAFAGELEKKLLN